MMDALIECLGCSIMEDLRQQARDLVHVIVNNLGPLLQFTDDAITAEQLTRVIDAMEIVNMLAIRIIDNVQDPPVAPGNQINVDDEAESGMTYE